MTRFSFLPSSERRELGVCVRSQREDHGIVRRANAFLLLDDGKSCQVIAEFLYLDDDTIHDLSISGGEIVILLIIRLIP